MSRYPVTGKRIGGTADPTLYVMTRPHRDETGHMWDVGTRYHPSSAGRDNAHHSGYQRVTIGGAVVTFRSAEG